MLRFPVRLTPVVGLALGLALTACAPVTTTQHPGALGGDVNSGSAGQSTSAPPPTTTPTIPAANQPPSITGSPATAVTVGNAYSFQPAAADPEGNPLSFSIAAKPSWASFGTSTGELTGTPNSGQTGTYSGIVISVSDGTHSVSLPSFSITVVAAGSAPPPVTTGTANLSWLAPTQNTDGSALTNLAGYRIYHGTNASSLSYAAQVGASTTSYIYGSLASGTHYFAVSAYNAVGVESALSTVGSKSIP